MKLSLCLSYAAILVDGSEGFSANAYLDTLAKPPVWTIGHGTTHINGEPVRAGMTCSREQADLWRMSVLLDNAYFILNKVTVPLNEWQLAGLVSFTYNEGEGAFARSTVLTTLNRGLTRSAADRLLLYDMAGGKKVPGLLARRYRERSVFLMGLGDPADPVVSGIPPMPPPSDDPPTTAAPAEDEADVLNQQQLDQLKPPA